MNLLLQKSNQMPFHTDMRRIFAAIPGVCESHDWLISEVDCHPWPNEQFSDKNNPILISGQALAALLSTHRIQFVWAVFSALPPGTYPDVSDPPYADGNDQFWTGVPRPQLKEALFEIVCWDSSLTLLIGAPPKIAKPFQAHFMNAMDLDQYNAARMA